MQDGKLHKSGFLSLSILPIDSEQKLWYNKRLRNSGRCDSVAAGRIFVRELERTKARLDFSRRASSLHGVTELHEPNAAPPNPVSQGLTLCDTPRAVSIVCLCAVQPVVLSLESIGSAHDKSLSGLGGFPSSLCYYYSTLGSICQ